MVLEWFLNPSGEKGSSEMTEFPLQDFSSPAIEIELNACFAQVFDGASGMLVDSEWVQNPNCNALVAIATPPVDLVAEVPLDHRPGQLICIQGPHGHMEIEPPPTAQPGAKLHYRLKPPPEFKIEVPPGAGPGTQLKFNRADGVPISVEVPAGLRPGNIFELCPPALMVRVPAGAKPGMSIVFNSGHSSNGVAQWCRARVPDGFGPDEYFAARLPAP